MSFPRDFESMQRAIASIISQDFAFDGDDGEDRRVSGAERLRAAHRSLRHAHATPDLASSLLQQPSPDPFYISRGFQGLPASGSMPGLERHSPFVMGGRLANQDTNRRPRPLLRPHLSSLDIPKRYGGNAIFDLYSLVYVSEPDVNLLCPICHDPLVDPVTTPCDHTFCYRCLRRTIASCSARSTCPIDRDPLVWSDCVSAARLIRTQLNNLVVKCPYSARGCDQEMRREMAEQHVKNDCIFRTYRCPGRDCNQRIRYKPTDDKCRHQPDSCTYCHAAIEDADREFHLLSCPSSKTRCEACWQLVCRDQMDVHHDLDCDGVEVTCPYNEVGCPVRVMRANLDLHTLVCAFHPDTPSGAIIRTQRELIQTYGDLGSQLHDVYARQDEANRRLDEIAASISGSSEDNMAVRDSRTIQDVDAGFEEVHQNLTQLEARQSMWTLNQVMPIREEVAELRNNINMMRMHVNWLMNRSREAAARTRAADDAGTASTPMFPEGPSQVRARLPDRRRSSSMEFDVPRL